MACVLELNNVRKSYTDAKREHNIFSNINLQVEQGQSVLLLGNSGCGKSTLLQIAGLIQNCEGDVFIEGENCHSKTTKEKNDILKRKIGFIYQFHYLFADFTALENLIIPQIIKGVSRKEAEKGAINILKKMKIEHRKDAMPNELSGGERQRVAIARAIVKEPKLILADEPTGNLDNDMSNVVVEELLQLVREKNMALLMVSHNREFSKKFDRTYELTQNGLIELK